MPLKKPNEFIVDFRIIFRQLRTFTGIGFEVIEFNLRIEAVSHSLPRAHSSRLKNFTHDAGVGITSLFSEFPIEYPLLHGQRFIAEHFAAANFLDIYVIAPEGKDLLDPETFGRIAKFQEWLGTNAEVATVLSIVTLPKL